MQSITKRCQNLQRLSLTTFATFVLLCPVHNLRAGDETTNSTGKNFHQAIIETPANQIFSAQITAGYDSRYTYRGVNVLPNTGISWVGLEPVWNVTPHDSLSLPLWYATATGKTLGGFNQNYREFDVPVNYTHTFGNLSLGAGYLLYTYFNLAGTSPGGSAVQNELDVNASYTIKTGGISWIPSIAYYYELGTALQYSYGSINPGSSFLSPALTVTLPLYQEVVTFNPNTQFNFSFGYNSNETGGYVWGANNWQITAPVTWQITKSFSLTGYVAYSYQWQALVGTAPSTFWTGASATLAF